MSDVPRPPQPAGRSKSESSSLSFWLVIIFAAACILAGCLTELNYAAIRAVRSARCQMAMSLNLAMYKHAIDHDGKYPDGKTSTEVFQKLLDGKYLTDPTVLRDGIPGEKLEEGQKLKPQDIKWDVTAGVDNDCPDSVPVIFETGFKVAYVSVDKAPETWSQSLKCLWSPSNCGLAVAYKNAAVTYLFLNPDGTISGFVPPGFDPKGHNLRQLTPDRTLP